MCLACGARNVAIDPAHVRPGGDGGMALKPSDSRIVPIDHCCHVRQHVVGELTFWAEAGIDPVPVAAQLYAVTGDVPAGIRVIEASFRARRKRA